MDPFKKKKGGENFLRGITNNEGLEKAVQFAACYMQSNMAAMLDVIGGQMKDAREEAKRLGYYKMSNKHMLNRCFSVRDNLFKMITSGAAVMSDESLYAQLLDEYQDAIDGNLTRWLYSIKTVLDNRGHKDTLFKARLMMIGAMTSICLHAYDAVKKGSEKLCGGMSATWLNDYDLYPLTRLCDDAMLKVGNISLDDVEAVKNTPSFALAVSIYEKKMAVPRSAVARIKKVLEDNPDATEAFVRRNPDCEIDVDKIKNDKYTA